MKEMTCRPFHRECRDAHWFKLQLKQTDSFEVVSGVSSINKVTTAPHNTYLKKESPFGRVGPISIETDET